jgi:hypothetical protein
VTATPNNQNPFFHFRKESCEVKVTVAPEFATEKSPLKVAE